MKRVAVLATAAALALAALAGPTGASGVDVCSLITRKEASKILGAKVVKTEHKTVAANPAQECIYKTHKFTEKRLVKLNAPLELKVVWAPLTQQLRDEITKNPSKFVPIQGVGDEAYIVDNFDALAIRGQDVVQASVYNWETRVSVLTKKSEQAVRKAVPRLPTG